MQFHMLTGPGTSIFRGMGRVYEEFNYSVPNLAIVAVALPAARWFFGGWTPLGIGLAVSVSTVLSACVLMGRVLFVLDMKLTRFLRVVVMPGLWCYAVAGALAWPAARLVAMLSRWQGAGVLVLVGLVYAAVLALVFHRWVMTGEERHKSEQWVHRGMSLLRGREVTA